MRGRSQTIFVHQWRDQGLHRSPDEVIVEEPLTIELDGEVVATTMRTPGHDFELAVGFCHSDRHLGDAAVESIRYCGTGSATETKFNVVSVTTDGRAQPKPRLGNVSSSCGLCGADAIDALQAEIEPLTSPVRFTPQAFLGVAQAVIGRQSLFAKTGAAHAAAVFDASGEIDIVREDIGRHNAVDKVVGRLLLDGRLPAEGLGLFVSGRASFEMVQKAWAGGFGALLAVSAPSALAVDAARAAHMQLAGFVRGERLTVYTEAG